MKVSSECVEFERSRVEYQRLSKSNMCPWYSTRLIDIRHDSLICDTTHVYRTCVVCAGVWCHHIWSDVKESRRICRVWDWIWRHDSFTWLFHIRLHAEREGVTSYIQSVRPNLTTWLFHMTLSHDSLIFDNMWRSRVVKSSQISRRCVVYTECETEFDDMTPSYLTQCTECEEVMSSHLVGREGVMPYIRSLRLNSTTWILYIRPNVSDVEELHEYRVWDFRVIHCLASGKVMRHHVKESYIYI